MRDVRRQILEASLEVIEAKGVVALSIRAVARHAGVSHQAPYKHFASRADILATLVTEGFDGLTQAMEDARTGVVETDLAAVGRAYVTWATAHPGAYRLLFRPDLLPETPASTAQAGERSYALLVTLMQERVAAGLLVADAADECVAFVWSTVHGLASLLVDNPLRVRGGAASAEARTLALLDRLVAAL